MTQRLTQAEVEARMYYGGIKRADTMMTKAEDKGRAHTNPYTKGLMQEYVRPLAQGVAQMIQASKSDAHSAHRPAHAILLADLDYDAVAFLTVRTIVSSCLGAKRRSDHRSVAGLVGSTIRNELVLQQIQAQNPDLYHAVSQDLGRRLSKDERHRMTVFKMQAKKNGVEFVEWPMQAREQVGMYLLGLCQVLGLVEIDPIRKVHNKFVPREVTLSFEVLQQIDRIKHFVAITTPVFGPCVERPRPWTGWRGGGYHTPEMQRSLPCLVRGHPSLRPLYKAPAPIVFKAANALQNTAWAVNERMLDTVLALAKAGVRCDEVVSVQGRPKPPAPSWLERGMTADQMTAEQALVFREWKNLMRDWYEEHKLNGAKYSRFYAATRAAEFFRGYPELHFVYFADSRGRLYPLTYGLNPQGSDLQRALIRFADSGAKPLRNDKAIQWFHVNGANLWGFDKAALVQRWYWAVQHSQQHLSFATDPVNNTGWQQADKPLQYLAWCFEYRDWLRDPQGFRTALPVGQDGTCNGLQHLSAMLRDEVGGAAVNLTASDGKAKQDIYGIVAAATLVRMQTGEAGPFTARWLEHGVNRSVVKRSVNTWPTVNSVNSGDIQTGQS